MQRVFLFAYGLVIFAVGSVFVASAVYAEDFDFSLESTISVTSLDKRANVVSVITLDNNVSTETPTSLVVPAYGDDLKAITATYTSGGAAVTAEYDEATSTIVLSTTKSFKGKGSSWGVRVSYSTNIVDQLGASSAIILPPSEALSGEKLAFSGETRKLELDLGLGVATRIGKTTPESSLSIGRQILNWTDDEVIDYATGVIFGNNALVDVSISTTLQNTGFWWTTKTVTLPPDTNQQKVYIENISPTPSNVRVDIDGNILADFNLRPRQSLDVSVDAKILVNNFTYATNKANGGITDTEAQSLANYLAPHTDFPVINYTPAGDDMTINTINAIVDGVQAIEASTLGEGLFAQAAGRSHRLIGTLRNAGIPARSVRGQIAIEGQWAPHVWSDVYVSGLGWITVDASADTKSFSTADVRYVGLVIRSADNVSPRSSILDTTLSYLDGNMLPESTDLPSLSSKTYMFFPWVGLRVATVSMPVGSVIDGAGLVFEDDRITNLGSLAPYQIIKSRDPLVGSKATKPTKISYFIAGTDANQEITSITSSVSWLPAIVEGVLVVVAGLAFLLWKKWDKLNTSINFKLFKRQPKKESKNSHKAIDERTQFSERVIEKPEPTLDNKTVKKARKSLMSMLSKKSVDLPDIHGNMPNSQSKPEAENIPVYKAPEEIERKPEKDRRKLIQ